MAKKIYKRLSQPQNNEKGTCPASRDQRDKANEFCTQGHTNKQQGADRRENGGPKSRSKYKLL